jgi:hypothetical protein
VLIRCGCFCGDLKEFKHAVHKRHGGTKFEDEYMDIIYVIKRTLERQKKGD